MLRSSLVDVVDLHETHAGGIILAGQDGGVVATVDSSTYGTL